MSLICPKCNLPLEDHQNGCPKKLSRRWFLGGLGTAFAAAAIAKVLPVVEIAASVEEGQLVAVAAPKVLSGSYIVMDGSYHRPRWHLEQVAADSGRGVIGKYRGDVVHVIEHEEAVRLHRGGRA